jgi:hypothetical protein
MKLLTDRAELDKIVFDALNLTPEERVRPRVLGAKIPDSVKKPLFIVLQNSPFFQVFSGSQALVLSLPRFVARWIIRHDSYSARFYKAGYSYTVSLVAF